ncbi:hypothetical protein HDU98_002534 [Podochytrium sp. JEL0797]|nr:hypothetical protein HDU98_002534 [Podochytrium sp. JEL0797]
MIVRTVTRSLLVILMSVCVMYVNTHVSQYNLVILMWNFQTYVLIRMINLDVLMDPKTALAQGSNSSGEKRTTGGFVPSGSKLSRVNSIAHGRVSGQVRYSTQNTSTFTGMK